MISIQTDSVSNRKGRIDYIMLHFERYKHNCKCIWNFLSLKSSCLKFKVDGFMYSGIKISQSEYLCLHLMGVVSLVILGLVEVYT